MKFVREIREFEKKLQKHMQEIRCPVHLSLGHETVAADIHKVFKKGDWLFSYHRNHHHYKAVGGDMEGLWKEIMGQPDGLNGGFSGSQGFSDPERNFHASAIVGGLIGAATGTALALKLDKSENIVFCCIGDAGTEGGVFWESLNFAALHKLPIVYIVENNGKSVDSPISERQARSISSRVKAFGIEVRSTVKRAETLARHGIPAFHEAKVTLECDHINMSTLLPSLGLH